MPPYGSHMTLTPEEQATMDARLELSNRGYHPGDVIDYDNALKMIRDTILKNKR